jgi:hypothetical protein
MTTHALIQPDGTVETDITAVAAFRKVMLNEGTVVTLGTPMFDTFRAPNDPWVGWVFDWGIKMGLPVNAKAWALYARSPIYGPMLIGSDLGSPFDDRFLEIISEPIEEWLPVDVIEYMDRVLAEVEPDET